MENYKDLLLSIKSADKINPMKINMFCRKGKIHLVGKSENTYSILSENLKKKKKKKKEKRT